MTEIKACTIVIDQSVYTTSSGENRKNELMVVSTAPKWNHDFISLAKFIELGNGQTDIRIFKMPLTEFQSKVDSGNFRIVTI
jgi:hypothetical protein